MFSHSKNVSNYLGILSFDNSSKKKSLIEPHSQFSNHHDKKVHSQNKKKHNGFMTHALQSLGKAVDLRDGYAKMTGQPKATDGNKNRADAKARKLGEAVQQFGIVTGSGELVAMGAGLQAGADVDQGLREGDPKMIGKALIDVVGGKSIKSAIGSQLLKGVIPGMSNTGIYSQTHDRNSIDNYTNEHGQLEYINGLAIDKYNNRAHEMEQLINDIQHKDQIIERNGEKLGNDHKEIIIKESPQELELLQSIDDKLNSNIKPPKTKEEFLTMMKTVKDEDVLFRLTQNYKSLNKLDKNTKNVVLNQLYDILKLNLGIDI